MSDKDYPASTDQPTAPFSPASTCDRIAVAVLIAVMLGGVWQVTQAARQLEWHALPHSWADFYQGRTTNTLEKQLDQNLPGRDTLIATANSLRYLLMRSGGDQVRVGHDGWLYLTDELRFHADADHHLNKRMDLLDSASKALERDGVTLVVALVPDKARVYPDRLPGDFPEYNRSRYLDALNALRMRGVNTVDLLQPLSAAARNKEIYYRSDTHWNQVGASIAAAAVAAEVRRLHADLSLTQFATETSSARTERPGDLIRLMGLLDTPNYLRPPPDQEPTLATRQISADNSGGLFGDATVEVVLTGTSYSLRGNFHGFLQQSLETKVLNTAMDGGGFLQAATQYLKDDAYRYSKPRVLIWEVPERFLGAPLDGEESWLGTSGLAR